MKSKEELIELWYDERNNFLEEQNNELVRFEEKTDFESIYKYIEEELKESYVRFGEAYIRVDLTKLLPQQFEFNYNPETNCDYYIRDIITKELESKGFQVSCSSLMLTININENN